MQPSKAEDDHHRCPSLDVSPLREQTLGAVLPGYCPNLGVGRKSKTPSTRSRLAEAATSCWSRAVFLCSISRSEVGHLVQGIAIRTAKPNTGCAGTPLAQASEFFAARLVACSGIGSKLRESQVRPNPSVNLTPNGRSSWPRSGHYVHLPLRGQAAQPSGSSYLNR